MKAFKRNYVFPICIAVVLTLVLSASQASAETYTYDSTGRLTSVIYDDGTSITYTYDAGGNILSSTFASSDSDGDGVPDGVDLCSDSQLGATVVIDGCGSGVTNIVFPEGCTISDQVAECAVDARNHGKFVSCVAKLTNNLKKAGTITGRESGKIQSCAARSDIP